ncbi:DNA mismatch repair ATPase MutS [Yasminevirus sp. GU-2018]|uniref:DNA mismatch repair ATPase MutS n=1 Tax=Yasminevirus sp. GU-2018 TaxID=2420051 RepID=A0A5K0U823_9VIRU|nr:DNA mismatch repair ATPase MutS [Yasminevirus sp. GU-2018]
MSDTDSSGIEIDNVDSIASSSSDKKKGNNINKGNKPKKQEKSLTVEYLEYHENYTKKFGKDRTLVLMQVGSFYEAYATSTRGPDLKALEELTEASIAHKGKEKNKIDEKNPWMWGFPMVAASKFIGILIENGYRLIMIDQITPKPNIKREVVAIHSPATYLESSYKPASNFVSVVCIEEIPQKAGQMLACIGASAIDVSTGEVFIHESLSQLKDDKLGLDETLRFLKSLVPKEILIFKENLQRLTDDFLVEYLDLKGRFYQIREVNKDHNKLVYQKKLLEKVYPDRENMTSIIDTLGLSKHIYARKALVNLLTYVSDHYEDLVKGVADPVFYLNEQNLVLGNDAINQLNIVDSSAPDVPGAVKFHNLLDVVNKASTGMGRRYIKFRLVSPYTDVDKLNTIYNAVETLARSKMFGTVDKQLRRIHDIERLYRKVKMCVLHPMQMVEFISSLKAVADLVATIIKDDDLEECLECSELVDSIESLNEMLETNIDVEKAKMYNLAEIKENIFKEGIYPDLDTLQSKVGMNHDIMDNLSEILDKMIPDKTAKGSKIMLKHNLRDGYYFQLTPKRYSLLKEKLDAVGEIKVGKTKINVDEFEVSTLNNVVKLSLPFLKEQTDDIDSLIEKIMNITHKYYVDFMKEIEKQHSGVISTVIDLVTKVDYYNTIAKVSKEYNYVRPVIKTQITPKMKVSQKGTKRSKTAKIEDEEDSSLEDGYVIAEQIRHPIVERIIEHEYVPHDVKIGTPDLKGMLIYGLNSAGKSVLMKAIGISIIMAQAGFFVPAKKFTFYPYKALYTRITGNDNLFRGLSSYSLEIVELNSILKRSTKSTLVIGDEVCRGTEHISGNAIVATTLLRLSEIGASFVFATHLHEIVELDEISSKDNIKAFHLSVEHDEKTDRLIYDRELKPGSGERIYGITVAKYIIKDDDFIKTALEIKNRLINRDPNSSAVSTKRSRYNADLIMDCCEMCGKKANNVSGLSKKSLETHHINHQKDCEDGFVKEKPHIKKNQLFNLTVLCQECHDKLHNENIELEGIKMTSGGKKLIVKSKTLTK